METLSSVLLAFIIALCAFFSLRVTESKEKPSFRIVSYYNLKGHLYYSLERYVLVPGAIVTYRWEVIQNYSSLEEA